MQGVRIQKGLVQVILQENGSFHSVLGFTPLILRWLLHILEEGAAAALVCAFSSDALLALLLDQFVEKVVSAAQSPVILVEMEA